MVGRRRRAARFPCAGRRILLGLEGEAIDRDLGGHLREIGVVKANSRFNGLGPEGAHHRAFETHADSADVVLPRFRELQARRDELAATLAKVVPLTAPPSHLYAETTIARFQQTIRDLFLGADQTLAKNYLRFLIDRVDISGNELTINRKTSAAVALLAAGPNTSLSATVNPERLPHEEADHCGHPAVAELLRAALAARR